jgi:hypothetical protein
LEILFKIFKIRFGVMKNMSVVDGRILPESTLPYWARTAAEIHGNLRSAVAQSDDVPAGNWLVFPDEQVGREAQLEYAMFAQSSRLHILSSDRWGTMRLYTVTAENCCGVRFGNTLLRSEIEFYLIDGESISITYNAVGDQYVRDQLTGFMNEMFAQDNGEILLPLVNGCGDMETTVGKWLKPYLPVDEACTAVLQNETAVRGKQGWFKSSTSVLPACALSVSARRVIVATAAGPASSFEKCVTMYPTASLDAVDVVQVNADVVQVTLGARGHKKHAMFAATPTLLESLEQFCATCKPLLTAKAKTAEGTEAEPAIAAEGLSPWGTGLSAQQELLRLTGVQLDEPEAVEALTEIHNFKWLEAERAGFDTWAIIQPENPLRAAAVHWVRKYFNQFNTSHQGRGDLSR